MWTQSRYNFLTPCHWSTKSVVLSTLVLIRKRTLPLNRNHQEIGNLRNFLGPRTTLPIDLNQLPPPPSHPRPFPPNSLPCPGGRQRRTKLIPPPNFITFHYFFLATIFIFIFKNWLFEYRYFKCSCFFFFFLIAEFVI